MQLTAVVLNAGLGELSLGLTASGFKIAAAYEPDKKACAIHRANLEVPVEPLSLTQIASASLPAADLLAAHLYGSFSRTVHALPLKQELWHEKFYEILHRCEPSAVLLLFNAAFLKSREAEAFLQELGGKGYRLSSRLMDVSEMTGFPVRESMALVVGVHEKIEKRFEFPGPVCEPELFPEQFLQLEQPADPWYSRFPQKDVPRFRVGKAPFLCWKGSSYQETGRIQWNFIKTPLVCSPQGIRRITHREIAALKGFPEDFILLDSDRQWLYRKLMYSGNLSVIRQVAGALGYALSENPWRSRQMDQSVNFEKLFGQYLSRLAKGNPEVSLPDASGDKSAGPGSGFQARCGNELLHFELKQYQEDLVTQTKIENACRQFPSLEANGTRILVIANQASHAEKERCLKKFGVYIWDVSNLLWAFQDFPDIRAEFTALLDFSIEHVEAEAPIPALMTGEPERRQEEPDLGNRLLRIAPGQEQYLEYEQVCTEILKYLLGDYLTLWAKQENSSGGMYRFDLCCKIKSGVEQDFFDTIKHYFNTKYLVFEFKNYQEKITQKEIYTTEKYLYEKALRKAAILISRSGPDEHALQAVRGSLRESGKLILCLSDYSLLEMLNMKRQGEQEPAEFLGAVLDDLLVHLEK